MDEAARTFAIDRVNRQFLLEHPAQAADVIDGFGKSAAVELLAENDPDTLARIWRYLSPARIDEIVPPGADLNATDVGWVPAAIADPALRRRPL